MKHLTALSWWLSLLFALQISAFILDASHYLIWGIGGLYFLKTCYLGFASVLFFRYLSFRSQKSYETMVESYSRISGKSIAPDKPRKWGWVNPWLYLVLVILSSIDFAMIFHWTILEYKISIVLDLLVWLLVIRYVSRAHWLKSKGKREKMKAFLDDSRSRLKSEAMEHVDLFQPSLNWKPFLILAIMSGCASIVVSSFRWMAADRTFAINDLKACMVECMSFSSENFYVNGQLELVLSKESCVGEKASNIDFNLFLTGGEIYLRGREKPTTDFFGNTVLGDESIILDPRGRFKKSQEP